MVFLVGLHAEVSGQTISSCFTSRDCQGSPFTSTTYSRCCLQPPGGQSFIGASGQCHNCEGQIAVMCMHSYNIPVYYTDTYVIFASPLSSIRSFHKQPVLTLILCCGWPSLAISTWSGIATERSSDQHAIFHGANA